MGVDHRSGEECKGGLIWLDILVRSAEYVEEKTLSYFSRETVAIRISVHLIDGDILRVNTGRAAGEKYRITGSSSVKSRK